MLSPNTQKLKRLLPESLDYLNDGRLRNLSGLPDSEYVDARKEIVDAGIVQVGRKRGGPHSITIN